MGNYTIFKMFENSRRSRQAGNFTTNVPKILDLKSSEQLCSKNCRWVPLNQAGLTYVPNSMLRRVFFMSIISLILEIKRDFLSYYDDMLVGAVTR